MHTCTHTCTHAHTTPTPPQHRTRGADGLEREQVCSSLPGGMNPCPPGEQCLLLYTNPWFDIVSFDTIGSAPSQTPNPTPSALSPETRHPKTLDPEP
eukprot:598515-Rhodomonas_salina.1